MKRKVLIVDDDQGVRQFLLRVLENRNLELDVACSGREALALLAGKRYDLLITDYQMPEVDGAELIRRARSRYPALGVIGISGHSQQIALREAGAQVCLRKPFSLPLLDEAILQVLGASQQG